MGKSKPKYIYIYTQCFTSVVISSEGWCRFCQSVDHNSEMCLLKAPQCTSGGFTSISTSHKQAGEQHFILSRVLPRQVLGRAGGHSLGRVCDHSNCFHSHIKVKPTTEAIQGHSAEGAWEEHCQVANEQHHIVLTKFARNLINSDCKFNDYFIYQHKCDLCDKPDHPCNRCTENKKAGI